MADFPGTHAGRSSGHTGFCWKSFNHWFFLPWLGPGEYLILSENSDPADTRVTGFLPWPYRYLYTGKGSPSKEQNSYPVGVDTWRSHWLTSVRHRWQLMFVFEIGTNVSVGKVSSFCFLVIKIISKLLISVVVCVIVYLSPSTPCLTPRAPISNLFVARIFILAEAQHSPWEKA